MVKAEEFWDYLCNKLEYRFFSGVPCKGLNFLYNKMTPEFMYYIPAINEKIAVNIVNGAYLSGVKGAVLLPAEKIFDLNFNNENKLPLLIIASGKNPPKGIYTIELTDNISGCLHKVTSRKTPGVLFIQEEED